MYIHKAYVCMYVHTAHVLVQEDLSGAVQHRWHEGIVGWMWFSCHQSIQSKFRLLANHESRPPAPQILVSRLVSCSCGPYLGSSQLTNMMYVEAHTHLVLCG